MRAVIFGAGGTGKRVYNMIKDQVEVVCFVDNDPSKWGGVQTGLEIKEPAYLKKKEHYDVIYLGTLMGFAEVQTQLVKLGVSLERLDKTYVTISVQARTLFLNRFAERVYRQNIKGSVGECGVFRGEFAKEINRAFPDRRCHLFDTFEGFDERDFSYEEQASETRQVNHLRMTSIDVVMDKMPHRQQVVIHQGYFPESIGDLDEDFCFINLDMDLYKPTLEGLRYFYPRMSEAGVILIHDYFSELFPNIEKAVDDYEKESGERLRKMPIGDDISVAVVK